VQTSVSEIELRRKRWPMSVRWPAFAAICVVFWPISLLLRVIGRWPNVIGGLTANFAQSFGAYRPTSSDVIVASGFKSGTNWTMQIAVQVAHRGLADFGHIHDVVPWPELPRSARFAVPAEDDAARRNSLTGLRVIKTHLPLGNVPYVAWARYICVVRDPKDVAVSSYFFLKRLIFGPTMGSINDWVRLSTMGRGMGWAEHLASFWKRRDCDNVLFLTYEEMKQDLNGTVAQIAEFMGVDLTDEEVALVAEKSSFTYMKSVSEKFDPVGMGPPWADAVGSMLRKGVSGSSREYLTREQRRQIDHHWKKELIRLGCDFPYEAYYETPEPIVQE
jgi:hypothetical protein